MISPIFEKLLPVVEQAGEKVVGYFEKECAVEYKHDNTPVTDADKEISLFLETELVTIGGDGVYSEEHLISLHNKNDIRFIDPIDGTRAFLERASTFNIIVGRATRTAGPVMGMIYFPVTGEWLYGERGVGTWRYSGKELTKIDLGEAPEDTILYKGSATRNPITNHMISHFGKQYQRELLQGPTGYIFSTYVTRCAAGLLLGWGFTYELCALEACLGDERRVCTIEGEPIDYFGLLPKIENGIIIGTPGLTAAIKEEHGRLS